MDNRYVEEEPVEIDLKMALTLALFEIEELELAQKQRLLEQRPKGSVFSAFAPDGQSPLLPILTQKIKVLDALVQLKDMDEAGIDFGTVTEASWGEAALGLNPEAVFRHPEIRHYAVLPDMHVPCDNEDAGITVTVNPSDVTCFQCKAFIKETREQ